MDIAGGVLLRDEKGVEIPEAGVDVATVVSRAVSVCIRTDLLVGGHLNEALREENISEFLPHFVQRM